MANILEVELPENNSDGINSRALKSVAQPNETVDQLLVKMPRLTSAAGVAAGGRPLVVPVADSRRAIVDSEIALQSTAAQSDLLARHGDAPRISICVDALDNDSRHVLLE